MKLLSSTLIAMTVLTSPALTHAADFFDMRSLEPVHGDAKAGSEKAEVCVACHGPNGNAIIPEFPILAGQREAYLYWELVEYASGTRPQSSMTAQAQTWSDTDVRDFAAYFAAQTATPLPPATVPDESVDLSTGEALFLHGDPQRGSPPCQGCHGPTANGIEGRKYNAWPIVRGQHALFLAQRLKDYRDGNPGDSSNDFIMKGVAHTLDDASIEALALYLSSLPPSAN
ncbi:MAG: c-type cytochrome [Dokdonella sp.]